MTFAEIWDAISETSANTGSAIKKGYNNVSKYDKEDILAAIGLEPKRSTVDVVLPAVGFFAVGVLAGVGLGMLFAPKPGYELREDISEQVNRAMAKKNAEGVTTEGKTEDVNPVI